MTKNKRGFTLIEIIVAITILVILSLSAYGFFANIIKVIAYYREKVVVSSLADQYLEIARNLPYSQVGTKTGNPQGQLPDCPDLNCQDPNSQNPTCCPNAIRVIFNGKTYLIYYVVNALHDPADNNLTVQDYKQVKLYVKSAETGGASSFVTTIAPISLAQVSDGGALSISVIDSTIQHNPIAGALINITNANTGLNIIRTSDANGKWIEVGLPSVEGYHIVVTKPDYSTDQTYSVIQYPNATSPDQIVTLGQVQSITFHIDQLSKLTLSVQNQTCQSVSGLAIGVQGSETISPGIVKFDKNYTLDSSGKIYPASATTSCSDTCGASSCCLGPDIFSPSIVNSQYMIYGTSPPQSIVLLPNTNQIFTVILGPKTSYSFYAVVNDASSPQNPIQGATVELKNSNLAPNYDQVRYTQGSVWSQNDWSGGAGQINWPVGSPSSNQYFEDNGSITTDIVPLALRLAQFNGSYFPAGFLTSSVFDTGSDLTSYTTLGWQASQDSETNISFQIAVRSFKDCSDFNQDQTQCQDATSCVWSSATGQCSGEGVWNFRGPDNTNNTFYTVPSTTINPANDNNRYIRYRVFLSTSNPLKTPVLSNVSLDFSECSAPGQAIFTGLQADNNYTAIISAPGYQTQTIENIDIIDSPHFILQVLLSQP
jgi:prepilin-type N-terminal cleavage/methylation domain-containing protein